MVSPPRWAEDPVTGEPIIPIEPVVAGDPTAHGNDSRQSQPVLGAGQSPCDQCGAIMAHDDIFCGECGFVSRSITQAFSGTVMTGATRQIDLSEPEIADLLPVEPVAVADSPAADPPAVATPEVSADVPRVQTPPKIVHAPRPLILPPPAPRPPAISPAPPSAPKQQSGRRPAPRLPVAEGLEDLEATRIVGRASGNRFILQFSTGESFTVHGSGLIGRNPQPEPGEHFEQLIRVLDSGKSVSKTHLEFGQEAGEFWINDRFSGNGTVIREPEANARRAESGRRYRFGRGTRVDIGEQFFVVS